MTNKYLISFYANDFNEVQRRLSGERPVDELSIDTMKVKEMKYRSLTKAEGRKHHGR
jgi:hypothetical protein